MDTKIYNSFKLLGYKLNELDNGYFIGKRPDGKESLFNSSGDVLISKCNSIGQVSEEIYGGFDDHTATWVNSKGEIIATAPTYPNIDMLDNFKESSSIIEVYPEINSKTFDAYTLDGKTSFKNVTGMGYCTVQHNNELKLVYCEDINNDNGKLKMRDTKGNIETLDVLTSRYISSNNHFIKRIDSNGYSEIIDFQGNLILKGVYIGIDNTNTDNDTLLILKDNAVYIKSAQQGINTYKSNVNHATFTNNRHVIHINDNKGDYLLNIKTMQRNSSDIGIQHGFIDNELVLIKQEGKRYVGLIDLETFRVIRTVASESLNVMRDYIEIINDNVPTYYSFKLEPIIHEF